MVFLTFFNIRHWRIVECLFYGMSGIFIAFVTSRWCYIPNMKALGLVVSDKKIFENCILKTYFLTLWHTYATNQNHLNKFGRGPFLLSLVKLPLAVQETRRFLKVSFQKYIYWPHDLPMQPTGTVWTILIGDHPGIISVKFGQIPIGSSREYVVWSFPYINQCKIVTPGAGSILTPGA